MLTRLNEAEWLIEPFFQYYRRDFTWRCRCGDNVSANLQAEWQAIAIRWENAPANTTVMTLEQDYDLDLADADKLCIRLSHADTQRLTLTAVIDGKRQTVIKQAPGKKHFAEYEGPITGNHLEQLSIELSTTASGDGHIDLLWLTALNDAARERYRRCASIYDPAWPTFIHTDDKPLEPILGLLLPDGVEGLRKRAQSPAYAQVWQQVDSQAQAFLDSEPEKGIHEHLNYPGVSGRYEHNLELECPDKYTISTNAMRLCALAGLVKDDTRLARMALRHALAAAHCTHWDDSFMMTHTGTLWDHRAFTAMGVFDGFVYAIEAAGALLTEAGRDLVARAISMKVLPKIDYSLRKYAYMRENNQAIFFASTGVLAICTLGRLLPHGGDGLQWYLDVLRQCVDNYIMPDGGTYEGGTYHDTSVSRAITAYCGTARYLQKPIKELLPESLLRATNYYRVMASTAAPGGYINTSDGGRVGDRFSKGGLPQLARITGDSALLSITTAMCNPDASGHISDAAILLTEGPLLLDSRPLTVPVFESLPHIGIICNCRPTADGTIRLQAIGAIANAGHGHEDKGSVVLEAFGEELLIDRGTCFYGDARSTLLEYAWRHNMLTPNTPEGEPAHQLNPLTRPIIPTGSGDEKTLNVHIDITPGWEDYLVHGSRTITSDEPHTFILTDTAERREKGSLSLHFQSRFPWTLKGKSWVSCGKKGIVCITPQWDVQRSDAQEDLFDSIYQPVYRLSLHTGPVKHVELQTIVEVKPTSASC